MEIYIVCMHCGTIHSQGAKHECPRPWKVNIDPVVRPSLATLGGASVVAIILVCTLLAAALAYLFRCP